MIFFAMKRTSITGESEEQRQKQQRVYINNPMVDDSKEEEQQQQRGNQQGYTVFGKLNPVPSSCCGCTCPSHWIREDCDYDCCEDCLAPPSDEAIFNSSSAPSDCSLATTPEDLDSMC